MNHLSTFTNNFVIGGFIIGTVGTIAAHLSVRIASMLYAVPITFIPILFFVDDRDSRKEMIISSLFATTITISFFLGIYLSSKVYVPILMTLIAMILYYISITYKMKISENEENRVEDSRIIFIGERNSLHDVPSNF